MEKIIQLISLMVIAFAIGSVAADGINNKAEKQFSMSEAQLPPHYRLSSNNGKRCLEGMKGIPICKN